jgi:hypothetical protein
LDKVALHCSHIRNISFGGFLLKILIQKSIVIKFGTFVI